MDVWSLWCSTSHANGHTKHHLGGPEGQKDRGPSSGYPLLGWPDRKCGGGVQLHIEDKVPNIGMSGHHTLCLTSYPNVINMSFLHACHAQIQLLQSTEHQAPPGVGPPWDHSVTDNVCVCVYKIQNCKKSHLWHQVRRQEGRCDVSYWH